MAKSDNDFINIFEYRDYRYPFQIFIGGRGTGKTYSGLKGCLGLEEKYCDGKFIWMRRTPAEYQLLLDTDRGLGISDLEAINEDFKTDYGFKGLNKYVAGVYQRERQEDGKILHTGEPLGYATALTAVHHIRGINLLNCTDWVYDEFIPEQVARKIRGEGDALLNAYETINRNRELFGKPPLLLYMLANSNDIYNAIFIRLGIVSACEKMLRKGQAHKYIDERGLAIHILPAAESFIKKKSKTALYKLSAGTDFAEMSLGNKFAYNDFSYIQYKNVRGYQPLARIDECTIYRKKGEIEFYCSYASAKCPTFNSKIDADNIRFRQQIGVKLYPAFVAGRLIFESYEIKEKVLQYIL